MYCIASSPGPSCVQGGTLVMSVLGRPSVQVGMYVGRLETIRRLPGQRTSVHICVQLSHSL